MISQNVPPRQNTSDKVGAITVDGSYLDWSAIIAGGVLALAISFLLISFGASLGLSLTSPYRGEGVSAAWLTIASGIWFVWVMVTGFGAGGYLAGRMRRRVGDATADEVEVRDGAHGLMVWAISALVSAVLATAGVGGMLGAGASAVGSAADTVTDVASEAASSDYFANLMLRGNGQAETSTTEADDTPAVGDTEGTDSSPIAGDATDDTTNTANRGGATPQSNAGGNTDLPGIDPDIQQQVASIIARSLSTGDMADRDSTYLAQLVAANTDMTPDAARARVEEINTEIADARGAALDVVEKARVAAVVFGFIAAATLLIGALAAFFSATAGGHHRDKGLGLDVLIARN
ncbi:hypothetical protein GCM10011363_30290 [Marivita lacus]|uniref:PhnA-like protein n=1 Tax=Marivita lacus TaxID=1323742 RepID=A0ABQ1KV93_9RHOB|nr:hypothetical protein [Marivita lacus]GGC11637.1 hypothetical protein GCM10011363_30290 [Marivita lacus]